MQIPVDIMYAKRESCHVRSKLVDTSRSHTLKLDILNFYAITWVFYFFFFSVLLCITFQGEQVRYIYNVMPFQKLYVFKILFYLLIIDVKLHSSFFNQ